MKKIIFILAIIWSTEFVFAQNKLSLNDVIQQIDNSNPTAKMYEADIRSMDEAARGAKSWMPPELGTGLWMVPYNPKLWQKEAGMPGMGQYMISVQQMFPNAKKQDAEAKYMQAMSSVAKEKKNYALNQLYSDAKKNYYEWLIIKKKLSILDQDEKMLDFMIKNAEIRYRNNLGKLSAYYKAKASLGNIMSMRIMLENEANQKRITLNTLMNRDKTFGFDIDTTYSINDYSTVSFDTTTFISNRSDIKAIDRDIQLTILQQTSERAKLKPEFGIRYEHMFGFGGLPMQYTLMGMVKIPFAKWSSKMTKANVESLKWKAESLNQQKQMIVNEATGMANGMLAEIEAKKKQVKLFEDNILPALRKNYEVMQLGYEQNTEELFMLYDAWETLNMTQLEYLNQLQQLLSMQAELDRILETK